MHCRFPHRASRGRPTGVPRCDAQAPYWRSAQDTVDALDYSDSHKPERMPRRRLSCVSYASAQSINHYETQGIKKPWLMHMG